jgi:hypothetical protein
MKKSTLALLAAIFIFPLLGCSISLFSAPTQLPTLPPLPFLTQIAASPTQPAPAASATATPVTPSPTVALPTLTSGPGPGLTPAGGGAGSPSGPYAVVLVEDWDVLYIRSAAGAGNPAVGSFTPTARNVMRTGPSTYVDERLWVQVQNPAGGTGWVNAHFLTEYITPAAFCADGRVNALIASLDTAFTTSNGELFASLVSPAHGLDARLWRYGKVVNYDREHARWVFGSNYSVNWGPAPGSGLETIGPFHEAILPPLQEVFNAGFTLGCNDPGAAAGFSVMPWPGEYTNINFYSVYKPGTPGIDLDWRLWLVGVEYVQGQPYAFSLIHFQWEP